MGYVYTSNPKLFIARTSGSFELKRKSVIDAADSAEDPDTHEVLSSMRDGTFDEERNLPRSKVERLSTSQVLSCAKQVLDRLFHVPDSIRASIGGAAKSDVRREILGSLRTVYEAALGRTLMEGEYAVFSQAVQIFLHAIQGRSFREIVAIRYNYVSRRDEDRRGTVKFSQAASGLPNMSLERAFPLFEKATLAADISYDTVMYDTYDYMDQVISFSLTDVFVAAFGIYMEQTSDVRAERMVELLRYGTNNAQYILLMRYGFPAESVQEVSGYVSTVDEDNIVFSAAVQGAPPHIRSLVQWYLPD